MRDYPFRRDLTRHHESMVLEQCEECSALDARERAALCKLRGLPEGKRAAREAEVRRQFDALRRRHEEGRG